MIASMLLALVAAAVLVAQMRKSADRPWRRWAFLLGAGAFGVLALVNLLVLVGVNMTTIGPILSVVVVVLMLVSLVMLVRAWQTGEMRQQITSLTDAIREEREKRGS
jgi:uncharacterized membrane protein